MVQPVHSRISIFAFIGIDFGRPLDLKSPLGFFLGRAFLFPRQRNFQQDRWSSRIHFGNDLHLVPVDVIHNDVPHLLYVLSVPFSSVPLPVNKKSFRSERYICSIEPRDGPPDTSLHLFPGVFPLSCFLHRKSMVKNKIHSKKHRRIYTDNDSRSLHPDGL